uniref:unspecific monooxygenase n=1 Tax=Yponomeuta padella TaxID=2567738 RepID=A0A2Z5CT49_YPOPA|nr:CYP332A24 [Yponomeuta padella]
MDLSIAVILGYLIKFLLISAVAVLTVVYFYIRHNHGYWKKRGIPYEKPMPFVGSLSFLMRKSWYDYLSDFAKKFPQEYVGMFLGHKPALIVQSARLARNILVRDFEHFEDRYIYASRSTDPIGSLNLLTAKNPIWSYMRREMTPMFTSARLKMITELMNGNAQELVKKIKRDTEDHKEIKLKEIFSMYTSDTVAYTIFGLRMSALSGGDCPLWYITNNMVRFTFWRGLEFTLHFLVPVMARIMRLRFFSNKATEYARNMFWSVVNERKEKGQYEERDLVNRLLVMKENMTLPTDGDPNLHDNLMLAQACVFVIGSVDTSSTTLSLCLHELAYHPEIQDEVIAEVERTHQETGKEVLEFEDLLGMKLLTACILETLRKYPPVPHLDRICIKEYKLDDKLVVEKGTPVFVNVGAIHHDPQNYPEPMEWRPERFIASQEGDNRQFTFIPFGEGPRFCIGKRYGMLQVRAALAQLMRNFRVEPHNPYDVESDPYALTLAPARGGRVKFIPRT